MRGFRFGRFLLLGVALCGPATAYDPVRFGLLGQNGQTGPTTQASEAGSAIVAGFLELLHLAFGKPAAAQVIWDAPNVIVPKMKPAQPDVARRPEVWPRLDRGSVLCKTEADLLTLAASRRGQATGRPNCQIVRGPTPIQIITRAGPGRTRVTVTEQNGAEGWTDAWLPDKPPSNSASGVSIR